MRHVWELSRADNQRALFCAFDGDTAAQYAIAYAAKYHVDVIDQYGRVIQEKRDAQKQYGRLCAARHIAQQTTIARAERLAAQGFAS
jgi:hypothetical protein